MSAYGAIQAPAQKQAIRPRTYSIKSPYKLTTFPLTSNQAPKVLKEYLYGVFNDELEEGKTYPQEGPYTFEAFETYFFTSASSTIIGIVHELDQPGSIEDAKGSRSWEECVGGCYYIKPNYPGRSSHNCNAGFLVPTFQRGKKVGGALAQSFLVYAPSLGYRASVFNLVYKSNAASLKLWDNLGFTRVGVIPQAGRLKTGPNGEEEYVDAVVVHKSFVQDGEIVVPS